jgi:hypothetical protein
MSYKRSEGINKDRSLIGMSIPELELSSTVRESHGNNATGGYRDNHGIFNALQIYRIDFPVAASICRQMSQVRPGNSARRE